MFFSFVKSTVNRGRPFYSASRSLKQIAFVFDIDGVLVRGSKALPTAKPALELLNKNNIPFILLTNGGGVTESSRVNFLSSEIGVPLSPLQIVQSHTPLKAQINKYKRVMVVGGPNDLARHCALEYGFKDVIMPIDLVRKDPSISPHHRFTQEELNKFALKDVDISTPVDAVLVFNDPRDMSTDIQIILDMLNSKNGVIGTHREHTTTTLRSTPSIPIIFSNNDFLWANDYKLPRFGQGAVRLMIEALYAESNLGAKLESTIMGKPFKVLYDYAHHVLIDWKAKMATNGGVTLQNESSAQILPELGVTPTNLPFDKIYMVGDNPASDIKGANDAGWESLLLRTGVYRDQDWGLAIAHPTAGVHNDVLASVRETLRTNGFDV